MHDYIFTADVTAEVHYAMTAYVKPKFQTFLTALAAATDPILCSYECLAALALNNT